MIRVAASNIQVLYNPVKPKVVHEIAFLEEERKKNVFKIEGYGEWESPELFRFITETGGIPTEAL